MAPLPTISNVFRVTLDWDSSFGLTAHNVLHFRAPSLNEQDIFDALAANLTGDMVETMSSSTHLVGIDMIKLDGTSGSQSFVLDGTYVGQGSGDTAPQVCTLVSLRTGLRGPANRGRVYLPFTAEGSQTGGTLDGAQRATQQDGWTDFAAAMALDGIELGVASYAHTVFHPVIAPIAIDPQVCTQRRRIVRS